MNAKCKKFLTMLLLMCVSIGAAGCSAYSNQRYYERAQLMMGSGEYAEAAELFHQLGEYEDSARAIADQGRTIRIPVHLVESINRVKKTVMTTIMLLRNASR